MPGTCALLCACSLALAACQSKPVRTPGPGVHVHAAEDRSYLVDPTTRSCFVLTAADGVPLGCHHLHETDERARAAITWIEPADGGPTASPGDDADPVPAARGSIAARPASSATRRARVDALLDRAIRRMDDTTVAVDLSALTAAISTDPLTVLTSDELRAIEAPPYGIHFARVGPGSLWARLGFRSGDRATTLNGLPLTVKDGLPMLRLPSGNVQPLSLMMEAELADREENARLSAQLVSFLEADEWVVEVENDGRRATLRFRGGLAP